MITPASSPTPPRPRAKRVLLTAAVLGLAFGAGVVLIALSPTKTRVMEATMPAVGTPEMDRLIDAGRYVATASDCVACHSAPGGKPYAGGLAMASPIGTIYSTNITPDKKVGIGSYTLDDFDRAIRHGITPDGGTLYPAMPYPSYAKLTDEDTKALYAYFQHGVAPVDAENRPSGIVWPLSIRWPLGIWRKTFVPSSGVAPKGPDTALYGDISVARGAYLVQSAGHCGSCHTARALTLQEKSLDDSDDSYLAGGQVIDGWLAINLRGNKPDGLGSWSVQDIVDSLKTGRNPHSAVVGTPMNDVVTHSTQHLSDEDLHAIAKYLKTLAPHPDQPSRYAPDDSTAAALRTGQTVNRGGELYQDNCAACHRTDAKGNAKAFPAIAGNPSVLAGDATSLIRLILAGSEMASTKLRPSNLGMPGFEGRLSDDEIAQLSTFVRQGWGNHADSVSASQVASIRKHLAEERHNEDGGQYGRKSTLEQLKR